MEIKGKDQKNDGVIINKGKEMRLMVEFLKNWSGDRKLTGVEVGVGRGDHAEEMVKHLNLEALHLVDHWQEYQEDGVTIGNFAGMDGQVRERFGEYGFVHILQADSLEAARQFENGTFDFIYVDANPSYRTTRDNIAAWLPKLKKKGILGGNNIRWQETKRAVYEWIEQNGNWYFYGINNEWLAWEDGDGGSGESDSQQAGAFKF